MSDYRKQDWLVNLPLYAFCGFLDEKMGVTVQLT